MTTQGTNYFYRAPADPALSSGTNVVAYLPIGQNVEGVVIPDSAIVWWNGSVWVYVKKSNDTFERERISSTNHVADRWLVTGAYKAGEEIVVKGAQILLSQEFKGQTKTGDD